MQKSLHFSMLMIRDKECACLIIVPPNPENSERKPTWFPSVLCSLSTMRTQIQVLLRGARACPTRTFPKPLFIRFSSSSAHSQETFEAFSDRYVAFFQGAQDLFEVQRGLNNCFAHDLVPSPSVIEAAVRAARRVNDYATTVRIFEGIKEKVENKQQYQAYLDELKPLREELGMSVPTMCFVCLVEHPCRHRHKRGTLYSVRLWCGFDVRVHCFEMRACH